MKKEIFKDNLYIDKSLADITGFNPYFRPIQSGLGRYIQIDGKQLLCLGSNDYLGLANNDEIREEMIKALKKYGISMCGTPIVIGQADINKRLECEIAKLLKQEDALLFPLCYQCNVGIFSCLAGPEDLILADKEIHSSLLNGIALSKTPARFFPHNNLKVLERLLEKSEKYRMRFIVLEGLYSTNGNVPRLDEISKIAAKHEAFIIIDDAHGVGVLGEEGRGVLEIFNAYQSVDLVTGSLGKGIGTFGGFLAGKAKVVDFIRHSSPMHFYSTALPPAISAATLASLRYIKEHPEIRSKINNMARKLQDGLRALGYTTTDSSTPLVSVIFNSPDETISFTKMLNEKGIYVTPFIPPSVPKRTSRIRMTVTAYLDTKDIDFVLNVFDEIRKI